MAILIRIVNILTFSLITLVIGSICYEGLVLQWFSVVPIFIFLADMSFILATVLNTIHFRRDTTIRAFSIFSAALILAAVAMKILGMEYPKITLLLWDFYIFFFHGILVMRKLFRSKT